MKCYICDKEIESRWFHKLFCSIPKDTPKRRFYAHSGDCMEQFFADYTENQYCPINSRFEILDL
jgi:hypothetical protein